MVWFIKKFDHDINQQHIQGSEEDANWIADELHISKYRLDEIGALDLSTYDTIIFGGPIFNGRIKIANLINSELANLNACEIIFFSVGLITGS
ncbi:hypothetical protein H7R52_04315 [Weissella confusa]|uniref:Flavodoxin domain-containing protein n=1 Tax=Weissella confusa TaxID=1583 RepID=A0A923SNY7_WEICO|nr:hypothetical protein [Weissella confusa]